jgi:hypothetical protein
MRGPTKDPLLCIGLLFNIDHRALLCGDALRMGRPFFRGANHPGGQIEPS